MNTWKARPTVYKGIQMRSRLEAKYAQELDKHQINWEYEPKCFADETGQYLPDFVLRGIQEDDPPPWHRHGDATYIEIKPVLNADVVARVAPLMERIFASEPFAELRILAPSSMEFDPPHEAHFYKGDWWFGNVDDEHPEFVVVFSSGRA